MKTTLTFSLAICMVLSLTLTINAQSLNLDKYNFKSGEKIKLYFTSTENLPSNAWIGIIPSQIKHGSESENDRHDLAYQYLKKKIKGVMIFTAPTKPGMYDFRLNSSDSNGKELSYITFIVLGKDTAKLSIEKNKFNCNEKIKLTFKAGKGFASNAWVGIIPSHISHGSESQNDKYDLSYQYLKNKKKGDFNI